MTRLVCLVLLLTAMNACNVTKYVPEDDKLYTGAKIKEKGKLDNNVKDLLKSSDLPRPNSSFLGIKYRLLLFNMIKEPKKPKGFLHKVKHTWGQAPVLLSQVSPRATIQRFNNQLFGNGYLRPRITNRIVSKNSKIAGIEYTIEAGDRYVIDSVIFPADTSALSRLLQEFATESLLKKGNYFDLGVMALERQRIDVALKTKGYYYFTPENLIIKSDTLHQGKTNLYVQLKPGISPASTEPWRIGDIYIYGNYTLERDSAITKQKGRKEKNYTVVDRRETYRSIVYDETIVLKSGEQYNRNGHSLTIERLMNLGTFRFVRMGFSPRKDTTATDGIARDTTKNILDTKIYLTPSKRQTLRLELSGNTKSNNFVGSEVSLNYRNVNLFNGAEILEVKLTGGFDWQVGGRSQLSPNAQTLDMEATLSIPRVLPKIFNIKTRHNPYMPRTIFTTALEYLRRPDLYLLRSIKFSAGWHFKQGKNVEHTIKLININAIDPSSITPKFDSVLANDITLKASFEKQLIAGVKYQVSFNNTYSTDKKITFAINGGVSFSGVPNFLIKANADTVNAKKLFNIPVSQFLKLEADITAYLQLTNKLSWVNKLGGGAAFAYRNSSTVPYAEQFFTGGSSSLRAFRIRTLGPGSYHTDNQQYLANESGEIKVEYNTEFRYDLIKYIKLAAFVDAGNIWLRKDAADKPGSGINGGKDILKEIAVGGGIGIRFDANVLVLRFDLAMPLRKPWYPDGKKWVINEINFGSSTWRRENLILNIGIGYPF